MSRAAGSGGARGRSSAATCSSPGLDCRAWTFGFLFPMLVAAFLVLAYEQFHQNARVAGLLLSVIGAGQVVGSFFAFRLVTRLRPMRTAAFAPVGTAGSPGCSCPTCRSRSSAWPRDLRRVAPTDQRAVPRWLSMRSRRCCAEVVLQSIITINQLAGPSSSVIAGSIFVHAGLHVAYAVIATFTTGASLNFILAMQGSGALVQKRLDVLLVERGLRRPRTQAQALVMAGLVPGHAKPGNRWTSTRRPGRGASPVRLTDTSSRTRSTRLPSMSRASDCLDVGASTEVQRRAPAARRGAGDRAGRRLRAVARPCASRPACDRAERGERLLDHRAAVRAGAHHLRRLVHLRQAGAAGAPSRASRLARLRAREAAIRSRSAEGPMRQSCAISRCMPVSCARWLRRSSRAGESRAAS